MKFTLSRAVALNTLSQLLKTCNVKAKGQPDSEFLFQEKDGSLFITATNDRCQQTIRMDVIKFESDTGVKFSADGLSIVEYAKMFPDDEIACVYDSESDTFVMGSRLRETRLVLSTPSDIDFIPMQFLPQGSKIICEAPAICEALRCTAFSAATEPRLSPKTAVKLSLNNGKIVADSMDDYRLSRYSVMVSDLDEEKMEVLVPRETAEILSHLLVDTGEIAIQAGTSHVKCEWDDTVLIARLEANTTGLPYPDISQAFNLEEISRIKASRAEIQRSLKIAGLVAKDSTIELSSGAEGFTVISEADKGACKHVVVADEQEGEASSLVAWKYMSKGVEMMSSAWIDISFVKLKNGHVAPVLIDGNFSHMVLPVLPNQVKIAQDADEAEVDGDEETEE